MRLGEMLIARRLIGPEDLERALEIQKERGEKIGKVLVDLGFVAMRDVLAALPEQLAIELVSLEEAPPAVPEMEGLATRFMRQCRFLPVALEDSTLTIAPRNMSAAAAAKPTAWVPAIGCVPMTCSRTFAFFPSASAR